MNGNAAAKYKILIIDDDTTSIRVLYELLQEQYQLFGTTEGCTALELAGQLVPDLILLDVIMPEMNGFEVCRALKENDITRDIPVIFLTARSDLGDIVHAFSLGAVDFVTKPFLSAELAMRVTTHIQLRLARQEIARKNLELEEQQGLFLYMIPHDLRTSLTIIQGYAERLLRMSGLENAQCESCVQQVREILRGCDRQKAMITDLVDVGRLKAGQFVVRKMPVPVGTLVTAVLQNAGSILEVARFMVEVPDTLPEVSVDDYCIERVLLNLLTNAQKFSPDGSTIYIRAWHQEHEVVVAVCDEGEEIPPVDVAKIFVPYYRARENGTTEGVGLGLYVSKLLVEAHGGRIWLAREPARENRFCFSLPLSADQI
jgi:signal transduction histidine kinase